MTSKHINLLHVVRQLESRGSISLKEIMKSCEVSRATAFRYIESIDRAGFPIYYDKESRKYLLHSHDVLSIGSVGINELLIICFALGRLASMFESEDARQVTDLQKKLALEQTLPIDELILSTSHKESAATDTDLRGELNLLFLETASQLKRDVRLTLNSAVSSEVEMAKPSVRIGTEISVSGLVNGVEKEFPLKIVLGVELLAGHK